MIKTDSDRTALAVRGDLRDHVIAGLLLAATVFGAYTVCLTEMVAHADDYWLLWEPGPSLEVWNAAGRWASGLFFEAVWHGADSIGDLWQPRLAGLVGVFLLSLAVYGTLRRLGYSWLFSVGLAALAALLPTFGVYVVWATCAGHVYACILAIAAFWLAEWGAESGRSERAIAAGAAAVGILYVSLSIYQPAGMFYVTVAMMSLASKDGSEPSRRQWQRWIVHALVVFVAMGASAVTFKLMAREVQEIDIAGKGEITTQYVKKLGRFVLQPVGQSCVPYFFVNHWPKWQMFPVELAILGIYVPCGLWFRLRSAGYFRGWQIVALLALIPATYVPNLVVASDYFPLRTRPAIGVAILFLLLLATSGYLRRLVADGQRRQLLAGIALAACIGVAFAMARYHLRDYFFEPSRVEWDVVCAEVRQAVETGPAQPKRIVFVMPDSERPVARRFIYGEYGYLSASCDWVTKGMTALAVIEIAPEKLKAFRQAEFVNIPRDQAPPQAGPGDWLINARVLNEIGKRRWTGER